MTERKPTAAISCELGNSEWFFALVTGVKEGDGTFWKEGGSIGGEEEEAGLTEKDEQRVCVILDAPERSWLQKASESCEVGRNR